MKEIYNHGFTSGGDTHSNGPIHTNPNSGSITEHNSGTRFTNGRGPLSSSHGSDSIPNRQVNPNGQINQQGKVTGPTNESGRPSVLATKRPFSNGSGPGKLNDVTNGGRAHTHSNSYTSNSDGGSSNGRQPQRHGIGPNSPNYADTNLGSLNNLSHGKNQPIRSGTYDTSGNGQGGRTQAGYGSQTYDQTRNRNPSIGKETTNTFDQTHGRTQITSESGGNNGPSSGPQTSDAISGFRNVFKLPPGLCLVKCDSLKQGQALTPDQIRDAFESSGLNGEQCPIRYIFC